MESDGVGTSINVVCVDEIGVVVWANEIGVVVWVDEMGVVTQIST